jgi:hypothetical protein
VTLTSTTLRSDTAQGGAGGTGTCFGCVGSTGYGLGGGLAISVGTVKLTNVVVNSNQANIGNSGIPNHPAFGGGLYIDPAVTVSLDSFTVANINNNAASTSDPNIHGSYTATP